MTESYSFALCLSHDVDRVYKTYQYIYNSLVKKDLGELIGILRFDNPYWQFERIMNIEQKYDVRSTFHFLNEIPFSQRPVKEWFTKEGWELFGGRYDVADPKLRSVLQVLDSHGWEIALHGSYTSFRNPGRFKQEKEYIESVLESDIIGNRQHYWRLSQPETWESLRAVGIKYDASLGSSTEIRYEGEYKLIRPFGDEFIVFPWTLMDGAVMGSADTTSGAWKNCKRCLEEVQAEQGVIVADWHQRVFYDEEFPNWGIIYEQLIKEAVEMGAWVGSMKTFYNAIPHPNGTVGETLDNLRGG